MPDADETVGELGIVQPDREEQVRTKSQRETKAAREPTKQAASPR
jgi:hypothetical protein